jgi:hypothetical protein
MKNDDVDKQVHKELKDKNNSNNNCFFLSFFATFISAKG